MIHIIFILLLLCIFYFIYDTHNKKNNSIIETFDSKHKKKPIFYPYKSHPKIYKKKKNKETSDNDTTLLTKETTGIDRAQFEKAENNINYLGIFESEPAPYFKITINGNNNDSILNNKDPYLKQMMNFSNYYE